MTFQKILGCLVLSFGMVSISMAQNATVSGYVVDAESGEAIIGATVRSTIAQNQSNTYGYFSIAVASGKDSLYFSSIGYESIGLMVEPNKSAKVLQISLKPAMQTFQDLVVTAESVDQKSFGKNYLPVNEIKALPAIFGEKDPIKSIQYLPGVQKGLEGSTNLFVRGGAAGENLLLLDEAPVYNANHFFGFFSTFNADAIKGLDFYKGAFPARYGGRLSSVADIHMKEGNLKKWKGEGGISMISSRICLEGPLWKDKVSVLISGRRTYLDPLMKLYGTGGEKILYNFYDLNTKLQWKINAKNSLFVSSYLGHDKLTNDGKTQEGDRKSNYYSAFIWGNKTLTARWNHIYGQKLFSNVTLALTKFESLRSNESVREYAGEKAFTKNNFLSSINQLKLKADFDFYQNSRLDWQFGAWSTTYRFVPREIHFLNTQEKIDIRNKQKSQNNEFGAYLAANWRLNKKLEAEIGLRQVFFQDTKIMYARTEPRLKFTYSLQKEQKINLAYSRMNQFVNQVLSSGLGLSTDLWFPADAHFLPQLADQVSVGYNRPLFQSAYQFSLETYFKYLNHTLAFKEGAGVFATGETDANLSLPDVVAAGQGISGGLELMMKKTSGKLTGWASLTLSRTVYKFDEINQGKPFFPIQDRRVDLSLTGAYTFNERTKLAAAWFFTSGNVLASPLGITQIVNYQFPKYTDLITFYGNRNAYRADPFHRLDITLSRSKQKKRFKRTWEFGIYNAYFRKNPLYYAIDLDNLDKDGTRMRLKRVYLLPVIPFVSYNFSF